MSAHNVLHELYSAPYLMDDPGSGGTITVDRQFVVIPIVTAAAEARTLAQPTKAGLWCIPILKTDGGVCTLTVTGGFDAAGTTAALLSDAGDNMVFYSIVSGSSYYWRSMGASGGVGIAQVIGTTPTASAAGQVDGAGIPLTASRSNGLEVVGDTGSTNLNGDYYVSAIKGNAVLGTTSSNASIIGVLGSLNTNTANFGSGDHYAVRGHLDFWGSSTLAGANNNTGALSAYVENEATTTVSENNVLCGLACYQVGSPTLTGGGGAAVYPACGLNPAVWIRAVAAASAWQTGVYMPVNSVETAIRVGNWVGSGASGSAIPFAAVQNVYNDGQLDLVAVFGESTSDLTSAYSAKCGRFRHLVTGSSLTINQESYGLVGQLCVKGTTLGHMHAGLMGTFEGTGAATVVNGAYTYGVAAIIARVGGGGNIAATKCLSGVSAILNGAAVASGTSSAFSCDATSTADWDYGMSLSNCTRAFNFVGACVSAKQAGSIDGSHQILIHVDGAAYALPVHAVG